MQMQVISRRVEASIKIACIGIKIQPLEKH